MKPDILHKFRYKSKESLLEIKEKVIHGIDRVKNSLGFKRTLFALNMKPAKYFSWVYQIRRKCADSAVLLCRNVWTNQLVSKEIKIFKSYFRNPETMYWPIVSMYHHARKKGRLLFSLSTWYRYAHILGLINPKPKSRRRYKEGIRAIRPNQYWHCDVTYFTTDSNLKLYIYLLIDNFSRKILSWRVSTERKARICFENIKEAYNKKNKQDKTNNVKDTNSIAETQLICDDGSENKKELDEFIKKPDTLLEKIIAQIDIKQSNSMVEYVNKILKYEKLYRLKTSDEKHVTKIMSEFVNNYNNERPCNVLNGMTPEEAYKTGVIVKPDYSEEVKKTKKMRILINRQSKCNNHK